MAYSDEPVFICPKELFEIHEAAVEAKLLSNIPTLQAQS